MQRPSPSHTTASLPPLSTSLYPLQLPSTSNLLLLPSTTTVYYSVYYSVYYYCLLLLEVFSYSLYSPSSSESCRAPSTIPDSASEQSCMHHPPLAERCIQYSTTYKPDRCPYEPALSTFWAEAHGTVRPSAVLRHTAVYVLLCSCAPVLL